MAKEHEIRKIWESYLSNKIKEEAGDLDVGYRPLWFVKFFLFFHYKRLRKKIIDLYMADDTVNIDRHKIAACVMKSVLLVKPLYIPLKSKIKFIFSKKEYLFEIIKPNDSRKCSIDKIKNEEKRYIYLNEYLALSIAIHILECYIKANDKNFHHNIVAPAPFPEPDVDYWLDVCVGLGYSNIRRCSTITYANVFFLLEKYSCRKKRCDNLSEAYKSILQKNISLQKKYEKLLEKHKKLLHETGNELDEKELEIHLSECDYEFLEKEVRVAMLAEQAEKFENI